MAQTPKEKLQLPFLHELRAKIGNLCISFTVVFMATDSRLAESLAEESKDSKVHTDEEQQAEVAQPNRITRLVSRLWLWQAKSFERIGSSRQTPAFLVSLIVHTILFLLLALLVSRGAIISRAGFDFLATSAEQDPEIQVVEVMADGSTPAAPNPIQAEVEAITTTSTKASTTALVEILNVDAPRQAEQDNQGKLDRLLNASQLTINAGFSSTGVEGRNLKKRRQIALARGGTLESEKAVEDALKWIAAHQKPNGSWSLVHSQGPCQGQCRNDGSKGRFDTAATGLALLAFLGAGYTHVEGQYRDEVRKGVYFLQQVIEDTPDGGSFLYQSERGMYNHGIATFAMCEAYQLTLDPDLKRTAQDAIDFIVAAQNYRGGWGYLPKQPGDLTLSGWQTMALKSAYAAGLDIPPSTIIRLDSFLDSQQADSGVFYGYGKPGKNPTCTAIGLMLRLFRGLTHTDPNIIEGAAYFQRVGRSNSDVYYNYYVTLFLHHVGGPFWQFWNPRMREHLIATQAKYGHEAGSWYFENKFGEEGGRLYTTAMAAMTLEVYYRYSPIYQQTEVTFKP